MSEDGERVCVVCQSKDKPKLCSSCQSVSYCCKEHQVQHWKIHKASCVKPKPADLGALASAMATLDVSPHRGQNEADRPNNHLADAQTMNRNLPRDLPPHITHTWIMKMADTLISCLNKYGIAVVDKLLGLELGEKILEEAMLLHDRHLMHDGQTIAPTAEGESSEGQTRTKYRLDKISWVDGLEEDCLNIGTLVTLIDSIMQHVGAKLTQYNVKGRTKAMVACYPGRGSNYMTHVDNPMRDGRLITCIYYLNKNWNCSVDGGMLKIYPQGTSTVAQIEPIMDRLAVFWSDSRNPHEVMPSYKTRFAVTTWYFDLNERTQAMKEQLQKQKLKEAR
ncbi:prolyl hydroxylase EGLN3-like [Watersipora subatra]|uniref:prolyl hydroxylase EGLN3-like n=1 Tax=Watersipora subatra TaxID=2589382 RepID=UPI00355C398D